RQAVFNPVEPSVSIGVEQATRKWARKLIDNGLLPRLQDNRARMFPTHTVLREQAGPVLRRSPYVLAAVSLLKANLVAREHGLHRTRAFL
ncbi:MAG: hypothetical protein J2P29_10575, partial [Actinobacteria bacterium]|nr:hypothetical protein [Actinomycetota bacterium]